LFAIADAYKELAAFAVNYRANSQNAKMAANQAGNSHAIIRHPHFDAAFVGLGSGAVWSEVKSRYSTTTGTN
jgi:hypothetical protein